MNVLDGILPALLRSVLGFLCPGMLLYTDTGVDQDADMDTIEERSPLLRSVREAIQLRHYSIRTEEAYANWIRRFILFHGKRHPAQIKEPEVAAFLSHLAVDGQVAAATQNQALNALVFLYGNVLRAR